MRVFTVLLFILTVVAGFVSHNGMGNLTEMAKLTYAYLALSTVACALIAFLCTDRVNDATAIGPQHLGPNR
ncbi:MAG TPA: hypothetical protein VFA65_10000 [Bryobacteraceae bacterium]|nr:hypothetical protein [Bryobacteraceae bacterium]